MQGGLTFLSSSVLCVTVTHTREIISTFNLVIVVTYYDEENILKARVTSDVDGSVKTSEDSGFGCSFVL